MQAWILLRCDKKWLAKLLKFWKQFHMNRHITESHRRSQGTGSHAPPKFLGCAVILCFEKRCLKQKCCCSPKIKHFGLPNLWPTKNFVLAHCRGNERKEDKSSVGKWNKACPPINKEIIVEKNSTKIEESDNESLSSLKDQDLHNSPVSPVQPAEQATSSSTLAKQCDSNSKTMHDSPKVSTHGEKSDIFICCKHFPMLMPHYTTDGFLWLV